MLKKFKTLKILFMILVFANLAIASTYNTVDISSGIQADLPGNPLYPVQQYDKFWEVVKTPFNQNLGDAYVPNVAIGSFSAYKTLPGTKYINSNESSIGNYEYQRCFCLDIIEEAQMSITLRADNTAKVFLNNYSNEVLTIPHNDSFKKRSGIAEVSEGFQKGKNCIRVRVNNEGSITAMNAKISVGGWGAKEVANKCCSVTGILFPEAQPMKSF